VAWFLSLHLEARPASIQAGRRLVRAAARLAGASEDDSEAVEVAVGEALANAYQHAYHGGPGPVQLDIESDDQDFRITIHNHGTTVTPPVVPASLPPSADVQGRGLYVMSKLMDQLVVRGRGGERGTAVYMAKRIHGAT
jgi:anti-sigma regulatory factor (Ser/Thr protein kinase)